jgi:hypothetical protein
MMMSDRTELLIGCGNSREKILSLKGQESWSNLTTLDFYKECSPDVVWDLTQIPLPFADNSFDEIHAYEVLEHTGKQGDWEFFFAQFSDFWRILKPNGVLFAKCPSLQSRWAWGDPSHTRILQPENLLFLSQAEYTARVGVTPMSDFRRVYKADFETIYSAENQDTFAFALKAIKPNE